MLSDLSHEFSDFRTLCADANSSDEHSVMLLFVHSSACDDTTPCKIPSRLHFNFLQAVRLNTYEPALEATCN